MYTWLTRFCFKFMMHVHMDSCVHLYLPFNFGTVHAEFRESPNIHVFIALRSLHSQRLPEDCRDFGVSVN